MDKIQTTYTGRRSRSQWVRSPWTLTVVSLAIIWFFHDAFLSFGAANAGSGGETAAAAIWDFFRSAETVTVVDFNNRAAAPAGSLQRRLRLRDITPGTISRGDFGKWVQEEAVISKERLLANIADMNLNNNLHSALGVAEGAPLASPSRVRPNYFYQWVRDGAITINTITNTILDHPGDFNITLAGTVIKYLKNVYVLQRLDNPSGRFDEDLSGLGEPKFMVDNTAFNSPWGRPQNDGPALRAITTMNFLQRLNSQGMSLEYVLKRYRLEYGQESLEVPFQNEQELFDKVLYYDLMFIIKNWEKEGFDLWEEVVGIHFFTALCQLKALKMAEYLLTKGVLHPDEALLSILRETIGRMTTYISRDGGFINPHINFIVSTPRLLGQRSGLDIGTLIGSILTHDELGSDDVPAVAIPFNVDHPAILNVLYELTTRMLKLYPINHDRVNLNMGVGLGRYPEDVYNGYDTSEGNPWFLATSTAAELLYKLIYRHHIASQDLVVDLDGDNWQSAFWNLIFDGLRPTSNGGSSTLVIPYGSQAFNQTMGAVFNYADSFLDKIRLHVSDCGEMSEQFNKYTGFLEGARDLSWSYGSFLNSLRWRSAAYQLLSSQE